MANKACEISKKPALKKPNSHSKKSLKYFLLKVQEETADN